MKEDGRPLAKFKEGFLTLKKEIDTLLKGAERNKRSHIQNYLYFAHHPVFTFTESIIFLCENGKPTVAKVLLRTLFEVHIDIIFHQIENTEQRLALAARRIFDERITILQEIRQLIKDCPNLESDDSSDLFSRTYLEGAMIDQETHRQAILRASPELAAIKKIKLGEKARLCEKGQVKNSEQGHFRRMYSLIYRQLSPVSHLNIEGLQEFVGRDDLGNIFFHNGNDGEFVAGEAIKICTALTKDLYDNGVLIGNYPKIVDELEALIEGTPRLV